MTTLDKSISPYLLLHKDSPVAWRPWSDAALAEADGLYAEATRRVPGLAALWVDWGWVDVDRRKFPQALDKANHALALNPDRVGAFVLRAYAHAAQSELKAALADYDAALARESENGEALRGRAAVVETLRR